VSFTAGELLLKVHNRFVAGLRQLGHKYFEGFTLDEHPVPGKPPQYGLDLGSCTLAVGVGGRGRFGHCT
jgi:hypothetical protein